MLTEKGGVQSAKDLLSVKKIYEGLATLMLKKLEKLSLEAIVLKPRFQPFFTESEIREAKRRLGDGR